MGSIEKFKSRTFLLTESVSLMSRIIKVPFFNYPNNSFLVDQLLDCIENVSNDHNI